MNVTARTNELKSGRLHFAVLLLIAAYISSICGQYGHIYIARAYAHKYVY